MFGNGGSSFLRRIKYGGNLAADSSGNLFIARDGSPGHVSVHANAGGTLLQQVTLKDGPWDDVIAADGLGNFYALRETGHGGRLYLYEYQIGKKEPIRQFDVTGYFSCMTTDSAGNLYLGLGYAVVNVYAPGSTQPERTITDGINVPAALTTDSQGTLYVSNYNSAHGGYHKPYISVYAPGATSPSRTFRNGAADPVVLHTDSSGNLGVLNGPYGQPGRIFNVSIFAPGSSSPFKVIKKGMDDPQSFAFDSSNNLYVANQGSSDSGSVAVYAAGTYELKRTITRDVYHPSSVAVGP